MSLREVYCTFVMFDSRKKWT